MITLRQLQLPRNRTRVEDQMEEFVDMLLRSGLGSNAAVPFKEAGDTQLPIHRAQSPFHRAQTSHDCLPLPCSHKLPSVRKQNPRRC